MTGYPSARMALAMMYGFTTMLGPTSTPYHMDPNGQISTPKKKRNRPTTHKHKPSAKRSKFGFR